MLDGKLIATLLGLVASIAMIKKINDDEKTTEHWWGSLPRVTTRADLVAKPAQPQYASSSAGGSMQGANKGDIFSIPGTYQAMLSPRFSNTQYGANISYNMPNYQNQAVPAGPLDFGSMASSSYYRSPGTREDFRQPVVENYPCQGNCSGGCTVVGCGKGGAPCPSDFRTSTPISPAGYADGNYNQVANEVYSQFPDAGNELPVGDMTTMTSSGQEINSIVYDRPMYAMPKSRLFANSDYIRGDLAIIPHETGWFRPSVTPNIDLNPGALAVMGGINNDSAKDTASLIYQASSGGQSTLGGVNMKSYFNKVNMNNQYQGAYSAAGRDVEFTSFP